MPEEDPIIEAPQVAPEASPADLLTTPPTDNFDEFDSAFDEFADSAIDLALNPTHEPEPEPAPLAAPEPAVAIPGDIWANASSEQKAAFEAAEQRFRSIDGRAAADSRRIRELEADLSNRAPAEPAVDHMALLDGLHDSEAWKAHEEEDPDSAEVHKANNTVIIDAVKATAAAVGANSAANQQAATNAQIAIVAEAHEDWQAVTRADFTDWLNTQPKFLQAQFDRNADLITDGDEVVDLITRYKASDQFVHVAVNPDTAPASSVDPVASPAPAIPAAPETNKRDRDKIARLEGNVHVPAKGVGPPSGAPDGFDDAFDYYSDKMKAEASG
tara:strand:+ start:643 stop:1629 length:987 start_codon:yes stop_codon:yes gene_type:complete